MRLILKVQSEWIVERMKGLFGRENLSLWKSNDYCYKITHFSANSNKLH